MKVLPKKDKYIKKAIASLLKNIIESKALYNSLSSIDSVQTNNDKISLTSKSSKQQENFMKRFCKNLNPLYWFKKSK